MMKLHHLALVVLATGMFAAPVMAQSSSNETLAAPVNNGTGSNNAQNSGNGSNGQVGDNPNATDPGYKCYRRDTLGDTRIVCPKDMQMMQGQ
jgi:hypothetical protein